ncbi:TPA: heparinase [Vibrio vulnificus]|nr:heparinase II/III family protein [Vibrio vulnificus]ELK8588953.1 alginate lyase family protein [Vibrio vulnificus]MBN8111308.1 alginate lyase family protein [Vibrio vulnificus]RZQ21218.1 heparinase [Vibrio vulnificus]HAS6078398.1 heparinase [Vibrio vulnificus]HAS6107688.1 heparinase [Vibrio vulnificus]
MRGHLERLLKIFYTLKYLKFKQIYYRIYYKFYKPKLIECDQPDSSQWKWVGPLLNKQSLFSSSDVKFLNQTGKISSSADWNCPNKSKLWLYNLHYFDDLNSKNGFERYQLHRDFIEKWIDENPAFNGNGWEPYPISLRLVNWVKWCSLQSQVPPKYLKSMLEQANALTQQLEYHILGNHLFANAKALTFIGAYLKGENSNKLLMQGIKLLNEELEEQFLDDGAHFELSPMYHEILLWDLLELIDLAKTSDKPQFIESLPQWIRIAEKALFWLSTMVHNDGEVSFFNDAAIGIAMQPSQIFAYAEKLGIAYELVNKSLVTNKSSGYSRITFTNYSAIFDHANVGPDYLPGHAHADTLSFELSIGKQRVFVNSGTSLYGTSKERVRQRQTPAHNTVSVAGLDSSQVWSGFRVAKRAYAHLEDAINTPERVLLSASHNGYMQQSPKVKHTRNLICSPDSFIIIDTLSKATPACFHLHLHPNIDVVKVSEVEINLILDGESLCLVTSSEPILVKVGTWHPEFGKTIANKKIEINFANGNLKTEITKIKRES